jgi:hypothetical protein
VVYKQVHNSPSERAGPARIQLLLLLLLMMMLVVVLKQEASVWSASHRTTSSMHAT